MLKRTKMASLLAAAVILTGPAALAADAADVPKRESAQRACKGAKGETKKECEKVAAEIDARTANPAAYPDAGDSRSSSQDIHHSSPVARTPEQQKKDVEAAKKEKREQSSSDKTPPK